MTVGRARRYQHSSFCARVQTMHGKEMFEARTIAIEAHIPEQLRHARREDTQHGAARQADKQRGPGQPDVGDRALWTLGWSKIECCGLSCVGRGVEIRRRRRGSCRA